MARKFKDNQDAINSAQEAAGVDFPMTVKVEDGKLVIFEYEKEWNTGNIDAGEKPKKQKLTGEQIEAIEAWRTKDQVKPKDK